LFYFITDLDVDENENMYVSDSIDCNIKKIDKNGNILGKAGRKGQGPGEFQFPVIIKVFNNSVYVVDQGKVGISIFTKELKYINSIVFPYPIYDLNILSNNEIVLACMMSNATPSIIKINQKGEIIRGEIKGGFNNNEWWKSMGKIAIDKNDNVFYVSAFENTIYKCDKELKVMWKITLGIKKHATLETADTKIGKVVLPTEMIYKDIKLDVNGNIYLLSGIKNKDNSRDVIVLNSTGENIGKIVIPYPTYIFHIDNKNQIYALADEGITIKKYQFK